MSDGLDDIRIILGREIAEHKLKEVAKKAARYTWSSPQWVTTTSDTTAGNITTSWNVEPRTVPAQARISL